MTSSWQERQRREKEIIEEERVRAKARFEAEEELREKREREKEREKRREESRKRALEEAAREFERQQKQEKVKKRNERVSALVMEVTHFNRANSEKILLNHDIVEKMPAEFTLDRVYELIGSPSANTPAADPPGTYAEYCKKYAGGFQQKIAILGMFVVILLLTAILISSIFSISNDIAAGVAWILCLAMFIAYALHKKRSRRRDYDAMIAKTRELTEARNLVFDSFVNLDVEIVDTVLRKQFSAIPAFLHIPYKLNIDRSARKIIINYAFLARDKMPKSIMERGGAYNNTSPNSIKEKSQERLDEEYLQYAYKIPLVIAGTCFSSLPSISHIICNGYFGEKEDISSGKCVLAADVDITIWATAMPETLPASATELQVLLQRFSFAYDENGVTPFA